MAAFEISAENRKNRKNNNRKQARSWKINHLAKASGFISQLLSCATVGAPNEKARRGFSPGLPTTFPDCAFSHKSCNDANENLTALAVGGPLRPRAIEALCREDFPLKNGGTGVMTKYLRITVTLLALMAGGGSVGAQPAPDPRVADLAKAGQLRVGLFPPQYVKDATTGELKGVWAETGRALAKRIGVRAVLLEHPTPVKAAECLKAGLCDAVILALAPRSAEAGDLSAPFLQFDFTFLVSGGSQIQNMTELDRPDTRIAAVRDHLSTLALAKLIKQAELVYGESPDSAFDLLRTEKAVAFASTRPALMDYLKRLPGSRVLETSYGENLQSIVVQKGHAGHLAYVSEFLDEAKVSGWLQATIERSGPPGIKVVPKGN